MINTNLSDADVYREGGQVPTERRQVLRGCERAHVDKHPHG